MDPGQDKGQPGQIQTAETENSMDGQGVEKPGGEQFRG